jgi:pimeloyl-ACP methyl ester carboxylesterase
MDSLAPTRTSRVHRLRYWLKRLARWMAFATVALALAGSLYQALALRYDRASLAPPGRMVDIGTHRLHLWCQGSGEPAVLLDAGAGGWSIHWQTIQPELARRTQTCSFDRSGLGWSEAGLGAPDALSASRELRALVERAPLRRPFVYVGHSLGANYAQVYAGSFPGDLAGIVLIDPGAPKDLLEDFRGDRPAALAIAGCGWKCSVATWATRLGLTRVLTQFMPARRMSPQIHRLYRVGLAQPAAAATLIASLEFLPKTAYQVLAVPGYGTLPLTILNSGALRRPEGSETPHDVEVWHQGYLDLMRQIAAGSSRGRGPIVVPGATHSSIVLDSEHARTVIAEIERIVDSVPAGGPLQ